MVRAIQTAYYQKAMNPSLPEILQECARAIGLDAQAFLADLISPAIEQELQREIQQARSMNVYSYPSLRLMDNDAVFPIAVDYLNHQSMLEEINNILRQTNAI